MKKALILAAAQAPITVQVAMAWDIPDWQFWAGILAIAWCMVLCRMAGAIK